MINTVQGHVITASMCTIQTRSTSTFTVQRSALTRCIGILLRPSVISTCRLHGGTLAQQEQALPLLQPQQSRCHQRSMTSFLSTRFVVACANVTESMESSTVELEIKVEGMKCGGCSSRVEKALEALDHVKGVQVDLDSKLATVEVEAESLIDAMNMLPNFVTTVKELGFEAEPHIEYQL